MKLLHLTHSKNIPSIIRLGLLPSHIDLDGHWDAFQEFLKTRSCVYLWDAETYQNTKFVRDMIYCKMFIHPRNALIREREIEIEKQGLDYYDDELYFDFKKFGNGLAGDASKYCLLEIDSDKIDAEGSWRHAQEPNDDKYNSTVAMDDRYAHDNKEIFISGEPIPFKNIKIVEEVLVRKYKNNNLGFSFRKVK